MSAPRVAATVYGKRIVVAGNGKRWTPADVAQAIRRLPTYRALLCVADLARAEWTSRAASGVRSYTRDGIPVTQSILAEAALEAILCSNDFRNEPRGDAMRVLEQVLERVHGLPDADLAGGNAVGALVRQDEKSFRFDHELRAASARLRYIFQRVWPRLPKAVGRVKAPAEEYEHATGLTLDSAANLAASCAIRSPGGLVRQADLLKWAVDYAGDAEAGQALATSFAAKFSASYEEIRCQAVCARRHAPPGLSRYALNPLLTWPLIRPEARAGQVQTDMILPLPRLFVQRAGRGAFYDIADRHKTSGGNDFRNAFGQALESYVGDLLQRTPPSGHIKRALMFEKGQGEACDWAIVEADAAVVVEVKTSSVAIDQRRFGEMGQLDAALLTSSLRKAATQLIRLRRNQELGSKSPDCLRGRSLEMVMVAYDAPAFANAIFRKEVAAHLEADDRAFVTDLHIISIGAFEALLMRFEGRSLFEALRTKRSDPEHHDLDFDDWLALDPDSAVSRTHPLIAEFAGAAALKTSAPKAHGEDPQTGRS